jgi:hypothetical protein
MKQERIDRLRIKWGLDLISTIVFLIVMAIGLRSYIPIIGDTVAPNFFEFNMYVYKISSPRNQSGYPDVFVETKGESVLIPTQLIDSLIHSGFLFQGDRWKAYPKLVKNFFCQKRLSEYVNLDNNNKIVIQYLKNNTNLIRDIYVFKCN